MTSGEISLNPPEAAGQYSGTANTFTGLQGQVPAPESGLRPGLQVGMDGMLGTVSQGAAKGAAVSTTGADASTAMGDKDQDSGGKIKGGPDAAADPTKGGGGRGAGVPRLTSADLARAAADPYRSSMPTAQTAAQAIPGLAQSIPGMLTSPLQSVTSPIQSMLSGPGGAQMLEQMLGKGGPPSLALAGNASTADGAKLQAIARNVLGTPYAWGGGAAGGPTRGISDGGGPADRAGDYNKIGFDCSGLARYVTAQMYGVDLPHSSQTQYAMGLSVAASQAQPGDLVFPASAGRPPEHVQIFLGGGQVLEAPSSGQTVKVSALSAGSEFRRFHS